MKIWLPLIRSGTGSEVSTRYLAKGLEKRGHEVFLQEFPKIFELFPFILYFSSAPTNTDVIVTNTWNGFSFKRRNIPMITVDRLFVNDPSIPRYKTLYQSFYHKFFISLYVRLSVMLSDRVVTVSDYTASIMSKIMNIEKPKVILNAVDTQFFQPGEENKSQEDVTELLYVGSLSKRKGVELLAPIMENLGPKYRLRYACGTSKRRLRQTSHGNIFALGALDQEQIKAAYQQADLLVFPSRAEGLPRVVMEAMSCGLPVVAANVSSLPEAVDDKVGYLCQPENIDCFVNAIKQISVDKERLRYMSRNARRRALSRFCIERMLSEYIREFKNVTRKRHDL